MSEQQEHGLRDFFLHLTGFITLYWSMIALITILFQLINKWFPDALEYVDASHGALRFGLSSVIVAFPVFVGIMMFFRKREVTRPRFPIYFTLFVTALTAIIDLATLIYRLTGGDVTSRFLLKVLSVFVVTGSVFLFEMWQLKRKSFELDARTRGLLGLAYAFVLASVVLGFIAVGSPTSQRGRELDLRRVNDLQQIQYAIGNFYQREDALPATFADLGSVSTDPEKLPYEYVKTSENTFEVCATFSTSSDAKENMYLYGSPVAPVGQDFSHGVGRTCFSRNVSDLELLMGVKLR